MPKVRKRKPVMPANHWVPWSSSRKQSSVMNHASQPKAIVTRLMMTARKAMMLVRSWVSGVISATQLK